MVALCLVVAACGSESAETTTTASNGDEPTTTTGADPGTTTATDEGLVIGFSNSGLNVVFPAAIGEGVANAAEELGVELIALDAETDVSKQSNDIQDLIAQGVDGILFIPIDSGVATSMVDQANEAGIPIVAVGTPVGEETDDPTAVYEGLAALVTQNEVESGRIAGDLAVDAAPDGANVAVVEGAAGWAQTRLRQQGFEEATEGSSLNIVAQQPGDWVPEVAYSACQNMLGANPDVEIVFLHSDGMLGGCAQALSELELDVRLIGVGGAEVGINMIESGDAYGTVCYKPVTMGEVALTALVNHLNGSEPLDGDFVSYDTPAVTSDNLDQCDPQW